MTPLSKKDRVQLQQRGLSSAEVRRQALLLKKRRVWIPVLRPCSVGDGIERLSKNQVDRLVLVAQHAQKLGRFSFFVPASGAATRLFTSLIQLSHYCRANPGPAFQCLQGAHPFSASARLFFSNLNRLALAGPLKETLKRRDLSLESCLRSGQLLPILDALLGNTGLNLAHRPKALVPFHWAKKGFQTAFEEQILEARTFVDRKKRVTLHFTISPESRPEFWRSAKRMERHLRKQFGVHGQISFSVQDPAGDTLAMEKDGEWARRSDGTLLFRPGGHGVLLANLEATRGDIVFVKNIDNVPTAPFQAAAKRWRLALAGRLIELQEQSAALLEALKKNNPEAVSSAERFMAEVLNLRPRRMNNRRRKEWALAVLSRPWRVCGMVPNKGEPGGGPFWVRGSEGPARQIVEASQLAREQRRFLERSTHFNPVDMVLGLKDPNGKPCVLSRYRDGDQVILSQKSFEGREIWTWEHPGLWNGSMAGWNSVFVEIPHGVFHPVKTVNDLLGPGHRRSGIVQ